MIGVKIAEEQQKFRDSYHGRKGDGNMGPYEDHKEVEDMV